jgi:hypothetical protein
LVPVRVEHRVARVIEPLLKPPSLRFPHDPLHELTREGAKVQRSSRLFVACSTIISH